MHKTNAATTQRPLQATHTATCGWCEKKFTLWTASQLGAVRAGNNVYCCSSCANAYNNHNASRHLYGPCPTCGKMFESRRRKIYCSTQCYLSDPKTKDRLRQQNQNRKKPPTTCPQCGSSVSHRSRKYCSNACRRKYLAERFDRWVANPERVALPQNFDEFLCSTELPCLIEGCNWTGTSLGMHVNSAHGITAEEFKKLAGFNKSTGLITVEYSAVLSNRPHMAKLPEVGLEALKKTGGPAFPNTKGRTATLEAREHLLKAQALVRAERADSPKIKRCRWCSQPVEQPPMGRKLYCSTQCRTKYYLLKGRAELLCSFCGKPFMASRVQVLSAQRGGRVCCSADCRNRMNLMACLASRSVQGGRNT